MSAPMTPRHEQAPSILPVLVLHRLAAALAETRRRLDAEAAGIDLEPLHRELAAVIATLPQGGLAPEVASAFLVLLDELGALTEELAQQHARLGAELRDLGQRRRAGAAYLGRGYR
jgi:hypothetical protein